MTVRRRRITRSSDRETRAVARREVGLLRDRQILPSALSRYMRALKCFFNFLWREQRPLPVSTPFLDGVFCDFVEDCWLDGHPKGLAYDALCGLKHFLPAVRKNLAASDRIMRTWSGAELPQRVLPMPVLWLYALAAFCRNQGWTDTAVALVLGFTTFTRTGELFGAKTSDFCMSWSRGSGVWVLPLTKSGQRHGAPESVTITDPWVARLVCGFLSRLEPSAPLISASPAVQRSRLREACRALGIDFGFTWYSLRRGGATHQLILTQNLPAVCLQGRWTAVKTARVYLTEAQTRLTELSVGAAHASQLHALARTYRPNVDGLLYA